MANEFKLVKDGDKSSFPIVGVAIVCLIIAIVSFSAGYFLTDKSNSTISLSGADKNFMSQLEFVGGFCERQGLVSSFRTAYNTDLNRYEGFPVCIQATK